MTTKKTNPIHAYILAGGKSSRMGTDKGLLLFEGKPLIEWVIEKLQPVFEKVIIVSKNRDYKKFGLEVIEDEIKDIGPAGGIHAAMKQAQCDQIFVASCDMPFITTEAARFILDSTVNEQITVFFNGGKIQPLFGVYSVNCLKKWEQLIHQKIIKLQEMLTYFEVKKINIDHERFFDEELFMNVNDKNDLAKALQHFKNGN